MRAFHRARQIQVTRFAQWIHPNYAAARTVQLQQNKTVDTPSSTSQRFVFVGVPWARPASCRFPRDQHRLYHMTRVVGLASTEPEKQTEHHQQQQAERKEDSSRNHNVHETEDDEDDEDNNNINAEPGVVQVYESPFAGSVLRLRLVSLFTGFGGAIGLPVAMALKDGDPSTLGFWLLSLTFGMGTMSTTAVVVYIFSPYVFEISRIPAVPSGDDGADIGDDKTTAASEMSSKAPFLYRATTRSMFLFKREHIFDPHTELHAHKGTWHPLCNLKIEKVNTTESAETTSSAPPPIVPLYVHTGMMYDSLIRKILSTDATNQVADTAPASNPDNDLLSQHRENSKKE